MRQKSPSAHHRTTLSSYVYTTGIYRQSEENLLNRNICFTCPHNVVYFGPLMAEIGWRVWGTPANFNRFRILALLLHRRRSTEVNQTLHAVWPSPALEHYIHIFVQVLHSPILAVLLHGTRAVGASQTLQH